MKVGKKVKIKNPNQINYPLEGVVIQEKVSTAWGVIMSKVKFSIAEVWYADEDLEIIDDE